MNNFYLNVLKEELVPALGCTEPIAIAYSAATVRDILGDMPDTMVVECSGNIIKNVKGVIVPGTANMKGIETSAILGVVAGKSDKRLEVLTDVKEEDIEKAKRLLAEKICTVKLAEDVASLYIKITACKDGAEASVTIADGHTNIVEITKNGSLLFRSDGNTHESPGHADRSFMTVKGIYEYICAVDTAAISDILDEQIKLNRQIAEEGLTKKYGANVGKTLIKAYGNKVENLAKAYASSGSDARMSGSTLPVVINSGSGNQGLTASLPVIAYAEELNTSKDELYRALALSNLIAIYIKEGIGTLSAFCGVVSAACGSGAAIAYLNGGSFEIISKTIINTLANTSGIVCDGAKPSCAAKIASAVDAAIMGYNMAMEDDTFGPGEGLVKEDVEKTIQSICRMARDGMKATDAEILRIMIED